MKAILFGSIGTLVETSDLQREAFNQAFNEAGLDWYWDQEDYTKLLKKYLGKEYLELYTAAKQGESEHVESSFVPREEYDLYL